VITSSYIFIVNRQQTDQLWGWLCLSGLTAHRKVQFKQFRQPAKTIFPPAENVNGTPGTWGKKLRPAKMLILPYNKIYKIKTFLFQSGNKICLSKIIITSVFFFNMLIFHLLITFPFLYQYIRFCQVNVNVTPALTLLVPIYTPGWRVARTQHNARSQCSNPDRLIRRQAN